MNIGETGTFTDPKDGKVYKWKVMKDGKKWMVENYSYKSANAVCYDNKESKAVDYGRLYPWTDIENAAPEGWRIPTKDEWYKLVWAYNSNDFFAIRDHLMKGKDSGFNLNHAGAWSPDYGFGELGESSTFWTSEKGGWEQGLGKLRWCFSVTNCAFCPDVPERNKLSCRFMAD